MSLMSKLLTSTLIASVALSASQVPTTKELTKYVKKNIVKNPKVTVNGVTIIEKKTLDALPGWTVLLTTMDFTFNKKELHIPETMFIKDGFVTGNLISLKTGKDYRNEIKPSVPSSMYNKEHLLYGTENSKHKIIVFSDPQCPFCQELVPEIIEVAKANPEVALYYYHLPLLRLHPVSDALTKIMHIAQTEGKLDVIDKIYKLKINPNETNTTKIIEEVKTQTGYVVTKAQIEDEKIAKVLKEDELAAAKMMVSGTPMVFIDGEWDKMRNGHEKFKK